MSTTIDRATVKQALRSVGRDWDDVQETYTPARRLPDSNTCWAVDFENAGQLAEFIVALVAANLQAVGDQEWNPVREIQRMAAATRTTTAEGMTGEEIVAYWPGYRLEPAGGEKTVADLRRMLLQLAYDVEEGRIGSKKGTLREFARLFRAYDAKGGAAADAEQPA
ncbi:hypothetical protein [Amycolatopsis sp. NPDC059657]|uniref:hypothetical protein n=1 Tax=Amycolatopsis sp. NPDC059657 TaxID=3346899 RepID=UPI00366B3873